MSRSHALTKSQLQKSVRAALRAWHQTAGTPESLLEQLQLVKLYRGGLGDEANPALLRLATSKALLEAIDDLEQEDETAARVLRWRFPDDNTLLKVAHRLHRSVDAVSRIQRAAIERLSEILWDREMALRQQRIHETAAALPPSSYSQLIGMEEAQSLLLDKLLQPASPWTAAILGIGGIGKTALADAVARQAAHAFHFDAISWVRAEPAGDSGRAQTPQQRYDQLIAGLAELLFPGEAGLTPEKRLEQVRLDLKRRRHLIVIDNLETETDTAWLVAHLNDLADPSKFLLTSRTRPAMDATIFNYSLEELTREQAAQLLIHHGQELGINQLAAAGQPEIDAIYGVTGGNPLALKLVVSLLDVLPLPHILAGLAKSQPGPIEALYRHIYWASWQTLSRQAQALLLVMPLVSWTGAGPEQLQQISQLPEGEFWLAVQELRKRSLLEVRGTLQERRYGIHQLTETFLHTEIIQGAHGSR